MALCYALYCHTFSTTVVIPDTIEAREELMEKTIIDIFPPSTFDGTRTSYLSPDGPSKKKCKIDHSCGYVHNTDTCKDTSKSKFNPYTYIGDFSIRVCMDHFINNKYVLMFQDLVDKHLPPQEDADKSFKCKLSTCEEECSNDLSITPYFFDQEEKSDQPTMTFCSYRCMCEKLKNTTKGAFKKFITD